MTTRLFKGKKLDVLKCEKLVEVNALLGKRTLLKSKAGNFFSIEKTLDSELIPPEICQMTRQEALDFLSIHRDAISQEKYWDLLKKHFNISPQTSSKDSLPYGAALIAKAGGIEPEILFRTNPGGIFYLKKDLELQELTPSAALNWIEQNQEEIRNLDQILSNHFPTLASY